MLRKDEDMTDQASKWHSTRKARMDQLFAGRKFRVVEEVNSDEPLETPLGYKIKKGYRLQLVEGTFPGEVAEFYVGKALLNQLAEEYDAVDKPTPKKRGRPRKQPIEQAEEWASRDIPADAQQITQPGPTFSNPNESETA
jgi:hypothetical protein